MAQLALTSGHKKLLESLVRYRNSMGVSHALVVNDSKLDLVSIFPVFFDEDVEEQMDILYEEKYRIIGIINTQATLQEQLQTTNCWNITW